MNILNKLDLFSDFFFFHVLVQNYYILHIYANKT